MIANLKTIIDAAKLKFEVNTGALAQLFKNTIIFLETFPRLESDYWILDKIRKWKDYLSSLPPDRLISPEELKKLEIEAEEWLNNFRGRLKSLRV